jgi:hypothetical protein
MVNKPRMLSTNFAKKIELCYNLQFHKLHSKMELQNIQIQP